VEEQKFYNRISRTLIHFYLREIAKITILSSARVKQTNKRDHLNAQRELLSYISNRDLSS
jgi:cobalamin biosynthesis protein CobD/CbiB